MVNLTLYSTNAVLLLSSTDGSRILAKYYNQPHPSTTSTSPAFTTPASQKSFEKTLFEKTKKQGTDIILIDNKVVVYKQVVDVILYLVGGDEENEVMLWAALIGLKESLDILMRNQVDKRTILENYDLVTLAVDEIIDDGIILETDPQTIASRVTRAPTSDGGAIKVDLSEQGLMNAWGMAKEKLADRILKGGF
ncbi:Golgi-to-ER vesicle coat component [Saitoella coloradoensis]